MNKSMLGDRWGGCATCFLLLLCLLIAGCATAFPRFSPEIQKSFRDNDMRRMETARLVIYYPEHRYDQARHIATRLEQCLHDLEEDLPRIVDWGRVPVFLPELEFNNAYAAFGLGLEPHIVLPTYFTANLFGEFGYTPSVSAVGCHEMVHYVHFTQIHGFFGVLNRLLGPNVNPQVGLDAWFFEGLATYYESKLVEGVGRHGSPIWENYFAAGIADTHLDGGRLSHLDRSVPFGGHYLVGSYFVAYLAETYGEEKLWELVDLQGRSFFFPLAVSLRFFRVYGKPLGDLIHEFESEVRRRYQVRERPGDQERLRWLGRFAMLEPGPEGMWAVFSQDVDQVPTLEVFDGRDRRILSRGLPDVLPGRRLVGGSFLESLRFSPDGRYLYFLAYHQGSAQPRTTLMRLEIGRNRLRAVRDEVAGIGGDITPGGDAFIMAVADGDSVSFRRIDLGGTLDEDLFSLPPGAYVGWVRLSPDGTRLAFTLMEDEEWSVVVVDAENGDYMGRWTTGESHRPAFDPFWIDDERLLFVAADGDRIDVMEASLADGAVLRRTDVPYMAFNPRPAADGSVHFLNREGWGWSLDRVDGPAMEPRGEISYLADGPDREIRGYETQVRQTYVIDDRPYSTLDGLFFPRFRLPLFWYDTQSLWASVEVMGRDELGFHNWAVQARWDFHDERLSGSFGYVNTQLAPWYLTLQILDTGVETVSRFDPEADEFVFFDRQDRILLLQGQRAFFDIPLALRFRAVESYRQEWEDVDDEGRRTLVGPEVATQYRAGRTSAYGGAQWLFGLSGRGAYYPAELGSDFSLGDVRSQLELHSPLPLSGRHRLRFSGRLRGLTGVPEGQNFLRVGGFDTFSPILSTSFPEAEEVNRTLVPTGFVFVEPLRGYEDFALAGNQVAIADLNYRYPIIVDRGAASLLTIFPALFFRGINLEAFASAATFFDEQIWEGNFHAALGASADANFFIWVIPLTLRYQVAQRLFDDGQMVHILGLGAGGAL